jgi:hypothetical protein
MVFFPSLRQAGGTILRIGATQIIGTAMNLMTLNDAGIRYRYPSPQELDTITLLI